MGVGSTFLKIVSGFLQATFAIISLGLIIYGAFTAYLILISNSSVVLRNYGTAIPALLTIVLGLLLLIFVFIGCCGICRESTRCLETYSAFLIILGLAHIAIGIYSYVYFNKFETNMGIQINVDTDIRDKVRTYSRHPQEVDLIQSWFSCCGATNYREDYLFYGDGNELPGSCCENEEQCTKNSDDLNTDGCAESVHLITVFSNIILGYISFAVGAVEMIAALIGLCLSCCIWRSRNPSWR